VQTLYQRRATFAQLNPNNPFSGSDPRRAIVVLSDEESEELKRLSFERETQELSEKRCSSCLIGLIVKHARSNLQAIRYSCTCDGSEPIDPSVWIPINTGDSPIE